MKTLCTVLLLLAALLAIVGVALLAYLLPGLWSLVAWPAAGVIGCLIGEALVTVWMPFECDSVELFDETKG